MTLAGPLSAIIKYQAMQKLQLFRLSGMILLMYSSMMSCIETKVFSKRKEHWFGGPSQSVGTVQRSLPLATLIRKMILSLSSAKRAGIHSAIAILLQNLVFTLSILDAIGVSAC